MVKTAEDVIAGIDWTRLRAHQKWLGERLVDAGSDVDIDAVLGLLVLSGDLQRFACEEMGLPRELVYGGKE